MLNNEEYFKMMVWPYCLESINMNLNNWFTYMDIVTKRGNYRIVKYGKYIDKLPEFNIDPKEACSEYDYFKDDNRFKTLCYFSYKGNKFTFKDKIATFVEI